MKRIDEASAFGGQAKGVVIAGHFHETDTYITKRPHGMSDWLITFTLNGEGYFVTPAGERRCKSGDLGLLRAGTPHQYGTATGGIWHFVWAHISPQHIEAALLPEDEVSVYSIDNATSRKRIYRAFRRVLTDSRERGEYWNELCIGALREVLMLAAGRNRRKLDPRIEETLHLLSRHMREPVRIESIAKTVGLSSSRLSHLFKESTGSSIIDALNRMRIRQAALLLECTDRTASEVAYDVGFQNYNHFIRQFRKWHGVNPSTYMGKRQTEPLREEE
jgi:AraC family transcriptional regulator of arabinose operon